MFWNKDIDSIFWKSHAPNTEMSLQAFLAWKFSPNFSAISFSYDNMKTFKGISYRGGAGGETYWGLGSLADCHISISFLSPPYTFLSHMFPGLETPPPFHLISNLDDSWDSFQIWLWDSGFIPCSCIDILPLNDVSACQAFIHCSCLVCLCREQVLHQCIT